MDQQLFVHAYSNASSLPLFSMQLIMFSYKSCIFLSLLSDNYLYFCLTPGTLAQYFIQVQSESFLLNETLDFILQSRRENSHQSF